MILLMKFGYPKTMFIIRAVAMLAILACILFIMNMAGIDHCWLLGFAGIFMAAMLITVVSPLFTWHEIDTDGIRLRQGMILKTCFPFLHIESVETHTMRSGILGLIPTRRRIVLASGSVGLVRIKLNHRRRFGMLLLRQADEIIIDLEEPGEFVRMANERLDELNKNSEI